ncbi:MAG: hypothetical protein V7711_05320 [Pseudomonadales bacterium]
MNTTKDQDNIEMMFQNLRKSEPYLPDDGFTMAVMAQLPTPTILPTWKKNLLLMTATVIGTGLTASLLPVGTIPVNEIISQFSQQLMNLKNLAMAGATLLALGGCAIWASEQELI